MAESVVYLVPHLKCDNAVEAVEFYKRALGAEANCVLKKPDGKLLHAQLSIGDARFFLADDCREHASQGSQNPESCPVTLHLHVPDADATYARAIEAGCKELMPVQEMFWGDRYGQFSDPYGHRWAVATTVRVVPPEEFQRVLATASA